MPSYLYPWSGSVGRFSGRPTCRTCTRVCSTSGVTMKSWARWPAGVDGAPGWTEDGARSRPSARSRHAQPMWTELIERQVHARVKSVERLGTRRWSPWAKAARLAGVAWMTGSGPPVVASRSGGPNLVLSMLRSVSWPAGVRLDWPATQWIFTNLRTCRFSRLFYVDPAKHVDMHTM